jgi:hypothetical protein
MFLHSKVMKRQGKVMKLEVLEYELFEGDYKYRLGNLTSALWNKALHIKAGLVTGKGCVKCIYKADWTPYRSSSTPFLTTLLPEIGIRAGWYDRMQFQMMTGPRGETGTKMGELFDVLSAVSRKDVHSLVPGGSRTEVGNLWFNLDHHPKAFITYGSIFPDGGVYDGYNSRGDTSKVESDHHQGNPTTSALELYKEKTGQEYESQVLMVAGSEAESKDNECRAQIISLLAESFGIGKRNPWREGQITRIHVIANRLETLYGTFDDICTLQYIALVYFEQHIELAYGGPLLRTKEDFCSIN